MATACAAFCDRENVALTDCGSCKHTVNTEAVKDVPPINYMVDEATNDAAANDGAKSAGESETTPDWNELCVSLCKTGDGGSLCNCDLSPFSHV